MKNVVIYARYSSSAQTEQSIEGQLHVCEEYCKRNNYKVIETYVDRATSANKDIEKRVEFLRMVRDSDKRKFEAVIVYKLDRFSRNRYDSANYKYRLKKNGVAVISATENISNEPEGIILESVLEGMAEFYSAELSQKVTRGRHETAKKHNSLGGRRSLGYKVVDKKFVIDEEEAKIVREAFDLYAKGTSTADICRLFNSKGYKSSKGQQFNKNSFHNMFRNERYIGVYSYNNMIRDENAIPAIIDQETWDAVQARLALGQKRQGAKKVLKYTYLLQGKLFCGHCGEVYYGSTTGRRYAYYYCSGKRGAYHDCPSKPVKCATIEKSVLSDALTLLTDDYIEKLATIAVEENNRVLKDETDLPILRKRVKEINTSLSNLTMAIETGSAPATIIKRMNELEREKKVVENAIKDTSGVVKEITKEEVIHWLENFRQGSIDDPEFCRQLADLFIHRVVIWHLPDDKLRLTIEYNLTDIKPKTYQILAADRSSANFVEVSYAPPLETVREIILYGNRLSSTITVLR